MGVCSRLYRLVTDCGSCRCFQPTLPPCGCGGRLVSVPLWRLVWRCVAAQHLSVRFPALTPASSGSLLDDLLVAEDARAEEGMVGDIVEPLSSMADLSTPAWKVRSKCRRSHADETCLSADPPCECLTYPRWRAGLQAWLADVAPQRAQASPPQAPPPTVVSTPVPASPPVAAAPSSGTALARS